MNNYINLFIFVVSQGNMWYDCTNSNSTVIAFRRIG